LNATNTNLGNLSNTVNAGLATLTTDLGNLSTTVGTKASQADLNTTNINLGNLSNTVTSGLATLTTDFRKFKYDSRAPKRARLT
jgi:predicted nuclease of predicted toxin-antitoxin system